VGFDGDDANFLAQHGFRAARVGLTWKAVEPSPGAYDDHYLHRIRGTVSTLAQRGLYSLIDLHQDALNERFGGEGFPDWAVKDVAGPKRPGPGTEMALRNALDRFWTDGPGPGGVGLQERYAGAAAHVASYFAHDRSVLGYDVINEPLPGFLWPTCRTSGTYDCSGFDRELGAFEQRVTVAIRQADRLHMVWYEPNTLFDWGIGTQLPPMLDNRAGMSFHDYCPPASFSSLTCQESMQLVLSNAEQRTTRTGDALLLTEFGDRDPRVLVRFANAADQHRMSWLEWAYCGCNNPTYPFYAASIHNDDLVVDPDKPPVGANVVHSKLDVLVRPYPLAIAGTPLQFGFDPTTKTFELTYTRDRADGRGSFRASACTEVFVPRLQYPRGYRVVVSGARVVSRAGAGTLALRALGDAQQITVRITPASHGHTDLPITGSGCASGSNSKSEQPTRKAE
jgi:endoglycosylceramidase